MSKPPKKKPVSTAAGSGRKGHQLPARVQETLWEALQALAQEERRSTAQIITILLEEALQARNLWPPGSADPDA